MFDLAKAIASALIGIVNFKALGNGLHLIDSVAGCCLSDGLERGQN